MNTENTEHTQGSMRAGVMERIGKGKIHMRPRWHFIVNTVLVLLGVIALLLTILYVASLSVFLLRDTGLWFTPGFGLRGWFELLRALPWLLIGVLILFVICLEILVRRFSFVYRKPLLASVLAIIAIIILGGLFLAPLHRQIEISVEHGQMPFPISMLYQPPFRPVRPPDVFRGTIVALVPGGFILAAEDGQGTSTVFITPQTRLPYGSNFAEGEEVVVIGDAMATGTLRAFGVRDVTGQ